jgi:hypothetical protein
MQIAEGMSSERVPDFAIPVVRGSRLAAKFLSTYCAASTSP